MDVDDIDTIWPTEWPTTKAFQECAAEEYGGIPWHEWIRFERKDIEVIAGQLPKGHLVQLDNESYPTLMFWRFDHKPLPPEAEYIRFHGTTFRVLVDALRHDNKLCVGWSLTKDKPGLYYSGSLSGPSNTAEQTTTVGPVFASFEHLLVFKSGAAATIAISAAANPNCAQWWARWFSDGFLGYMYVMTQRRESSTLLCDSRSQMITANTAYRTVAVTQMDAMRTALTSKDRIRDSCSAKAERDLNEQRSHHLRYCRRRMMFQNGSNWIR